MVIHVSMRARWGLLAGAALLLLGALPVPTAQAAPAPRPTIAVPSGASSYLPLVPSRLAETRVSEGAFGFTQIGGTNITGGRTIRVTVAGRGNVPLNAVAVVLNVALVSPASPGFVSVFPTGTSRPNAASLLADAATIVVANMVTAKLGTGGAVDIYTHTRMDLVVDVSGAYVPADGNSSVGRLVTVPAGAQRVLDTRGICNCLSPMAAGGSVTVDVSSVVPPGASAVVVNLTAVNGNPGFWTAFPLGATRPLTSSLNLDFWSRTRGGQAIVQLPSGATSFTVFSQNGGHLVVDVAGWFTGAGQPLSSDGWFIPGSPNRRIDTRTTSTLAPWAGSTFEFGVAAPVAGVAAVAINLTGADPWFPGFITSYPAGVTRPNTANLNLSRFDQRISNHAIVRVTTRGVALYTLRGAHLIADVTGWYLGTPSPALNPEPGNPVISPQPAIGVWVPRLNKSLWVNSGPDLDAIADQGRAAGYPDLTTPAKPGNMMLFAHRTLKGAPWYGLHTMAYGDQFTITAYDGRVYTYFVTRVDERVNATYSTIDRLTDGNGPITAQLVACDPPGSIRYRVVVTGRLISVT